MAFEHEDYMAARRRRLEANAMIARGDPGRFSSFERNALLGMQHTKSGDVALQDSEERAGLRQHEMEMLRQQGENELKVAKQKRFGMAEQGVKAAEVGANAGITSAEREWARREKVAGIQAENALELEEARQRGALRQHELEWGKVGADGTRTPGGREAVAGIEGKSRVDAAREQAKIAAEQNEQKRALEEQKLRAAQENERARLRLSYDRLEAKDKSSIDTQANALAKEKSISFEDARDQIMAAREQAQQQGGKKVRSYRYNADRTKRIPVYEDGSQGPAEDEK